MQPRLEILNKGVIAAEIEKHFDHTCDFCSVEIKSLDRAAKHYRSEHNMDGYLKCCGYKFKVSTLVSDHIRWHLNPKIFE